MVKDIKTLLEPISTVSPVGDDARYVARPGRTSPPFPGHDMTEGQRLREDWFPVFEASHQQ